MAVFSFMVVPMLAIFAAPMTVTLMTGVSVAALCMRFRKSLFEIFQRHFVVDRNVLGIIENQIINGVRQKSLGVRQSKMKWTVDIGIIDKLSEVKHL